MNKRTHKGGWETFEEKIKKGMQIPPKDKLTWLKDINDSIYKTLTQKQKKIRSQIKHL